MKRLLLAAIGLVLSCYDPTAPTPEETPIPPCTVYDTVCKNITGPRQGLQLTKCVRTSDPGCPVYSYMIVQPNEWQETCLHVNLDGSGETWYGPCNE